MGRAQGKHPRRGDWIGQLVEDALGPGHGVTETEGQDREAGVGEHSGHGTYAGDPRDIPGGRKHLANPATVHPPVPAPPDGGDPYRRALLAHGVHPDGQHHDRDMRLDKWQRGDGKPELGKQAPRQTPIPVYIVEAGAGPATMRAAYPRSITVPASTAAEPVRICGRSETRIEIQLLNEDTATDIRIATNLSQLSSGTGALLPWPGNSYVTIKTQGELYAIGATGSGTPKISIIEVFEEPGIV